LESTIYLKAVTAELLVKELNVLLRRRDVYDPAAWAGVSIPSEAKLLLAKGIGNLSNTELTRCNALLISAACPEITVSNQPPPRSLLGYVSKFFIPTLKPRLAAEMGGATPMSEYEVEARNALRPIFDELTEMQATGKLPPHLAKVGIAERIYLRQKERIEAKYGAIVRWYNERIRELTIPPQKPFIVDSPSALRDARRLLEANKNTFPERLWKEKNAPFFIPFSALEPFGEKTIKHLLDIGAIGTGSRRKQEQTVQPSATVSHEDTQTMNLLKGGHSSRAFQLLVKRLFDSNQAEYSVGMFLASNPSPSAVQVEQFLNKLPDEIAEDVESIGGWRQLVYKIDRAVLNAVNDQQVRNEIVHELDVEPQAVVAHLDFVHRTIFIRTADFYNSRSRAG
jgi:hypothetical protein